MARNKMLSGVRKSEHVGTVWSNDQYMHIQAASKRKGLRPSEFCRRAVDKRVDRRLKLHEEYVE